MDILYGKDNLNFWKVKSMEEGTEIINVNGVLDMYKEDCADMDEPFNEEGYEEFIKYLEIDFFDWVRGNLHQFRIHKNS